MNSNNPDLDIWIQRNSFQSPHINTNTSAQTTVTMNRDGKTGDNDFRHGSITD